MTGTRLWDVKLQPNRDISEAARLWVDGDGVPGRNAHDQQTPKRLKPEELEVTFVGPYGKFHRNITLFMTLADLYTLAFRGMEARVSWFELAIYDANRQEPFSASPTTTVQSLKMSHCRVIEIRTAEDLASNNALHGSTRKVHILVDGHRPKSRNFDYWAYLDTDQTLSTVVWKYWRNQFHYSYSHGANRLCVVTFEEKDFLIKVRPNGDHLDDEKIHKRQERLSELLDYYNSLGLIGEKCPVFEENGHLTLRLTPVSQRDEGDKTISRLEVSKQMSEVSRAY